MLLVKAVHYRQDKRPKEHLINYLWTAVIACMLGAMPISAADQTWTGKISDSMCGAKQNTSAEHQEGWSGQTNNVIMFPPKGSPRVAPRAPHT